MVPLKDTFKANVYLTCSLVGLVYFCRVKTLDRTYNEFMLLKVVCFVHHCQKSQDDSHEYAFLIIQDWTFLYKHSITNFVQTHTKYADKIREREEPGIHQKAVLRLLLKKDQDSFSHFFNNEDKCNCQKLKLCVRIWNMW